MWMQLMPFLFIQKARSCQRKLFFFRFYVSAFLLSCLLYPSLSHHFITVMRKSTHSFSLILHLHRSFFRWTTAILQESSIFWWGLQRVESECPVRCLSVTQHKEGLVLPTKVLGKCSQLKVFIQFQLLFGSLKYEGQYCSRSYCLKQCNACLEAKSRYLKV